MKNKVLISIKPEHTKKIEEGTKKYEYRNYLINDLKYMIVYESNTSAIKYIMEVDKPIIVKELLEDNSKFKDNREYKYAYPIVHLKKIKRPITLTEMKYKYNSFAPQKYVYMDKYKELDKEIDSREKKDIF